MTEYVVLRRDDSEGREIGDVLQWTTIGNATAKSAPDAIRAVAANLLEGNAGLFVAVPMRSWRPVTVEAVQTTVLRLS